MYTLHYVSEDVADGVATGTWSVYAEDYARFEDEVPIEGSTRLVIPALATQDEADKAARARQRASYNSNRKDKAHA